MTPARKLSLVPEPPSRDEAAAESARQGKHICDEARAYAAHRDWAALHVAADRRKPVVLADVRRVRRG